MTDPILLDVIQTCLGLEQKAKTTYALFSRQCEPADLKTFWQSMANEEHVHERYWSDLLLMAVTSDLPQILDEPAQVLEQLRLLDKTMASMSGTAPRLVCPEEMFMTAHHLEYCMLHPALALLFHFNKKVPGGSTSPEDEYEEHLDKFAKAFRKFAPGTSESLLIGEMVASLWKRNREYAAQHEQIHMLRRLIPICASCKKIRDDRGSWQNLESYFQAHSDLEFTHGVCPECMSRLYGKE